LVTTADPRGITFFLGGDVMTGRGIDQILPYPSDPVLYEMYMKEATGYVQIAEEVNGTITKPVDFAYIWGDALTELEGRAPDARIINLETSITTSDDYWKGKGINYRMNPKNIPCLHAAKIDICSIANNHILDWGYTGLRETLETLRRADIRMSGAGGNLEEARAPAITDLGKKGRVVFFAFGHESSGVIRSWWASRDTPGVSALEDLSERTVSSITEKVRNEKRNGDIVIVSIHWGRNWGYHIAEEERRFAHALIDEADVDIIHGHSSHHPKGVEVYRNKLILYGCGDLLNDYEGISGYEEFRNDLGVMYFPTVDPLAGHLQALQLVVMLRRRFRLEKATLDDILWIGETLNREGSVFGTQALLGENGSLAVKWR